MVASTTAERKMVGQRSLASGDAAPILQTAERDLDAAAAPVAALVVSDRLVARSAAQDAGLDALGFQGVPEPIGVITTVAKQPLCSRQIVEQGCGAGVVADDHEEARGPPIRIPDGVQFGLHTAFRTAEIPFFFADSMPCGVPSSRSRRS